MQNVAHLLRGDYTYAPASDTTHLTLRDSARAPAGEETACRIVIRDMR